MSAPDTAIRKTLADANLQLAIYNNTGRFKDNRSRAVAPDQLPEYQDLRTRAAAIKRHTLAFLDVYLLQLENAVNSYGGKATVDQIQQVLVPEVIRDDWKKWWEAAKRELKKDGHFQVPIKKTEPVVYQTKEISLQDRLMEEFRAANVLKGRFLVAGELLKNAHDL